MATVCMQFIQQFVPVQTIVLQFCVEQAFNHNNWVKHTNVKLNSILNSSTKYVTNNSSTFLTL